MIVVQHSSPLETLDGKELLNALLAVSKGQRADVTGSWWVSWQDLDTLIISSTVFKTHFQEAFQSHYS